MKKICQIVLSLFLVLTSPLYARAKIQGYAEQGGQRVAVAGFQSSTYAQRSYPSCRVTVYLPGTTTLATIYSTTGGTLKGNPFTAGTDGFFFFYTDLALVDIKFSAGVSPNNFPTTPFTWSNVGGGTSTGTSANLSSFATAGDGTVGNPWTGWDTEFPIGTSGVGTISVSHVSGSTTVTGVGSAFLTSTHVGDWICNVSASGIRCGKVSAIASDLSLTVQSWQAATVAAVSYVIYRPTSIYAPTGYYSFSAEWNIGYPLLSLHGDGASTRFVHTGTGKAVSADGNYPTVGASNSQAITLSDFTVQGNANTTYDLFLSSLNHLGVSNVYVLGATTAGIGVDNVVISDFDNVRFSVNVEASAATPLYGWWFNNDYTVTATGCFSEGAANGVYIASADGFLWDGGTIEGNSIYGLYASKLLKRAQFTSIHFEANTTEDIHLQGSEWVTFTSISSSGLVHLLVDGGTQASSWNQFIGGRYNAITLDTFCVNNTFIGLTYSISGGVITDNAKSTTWISVSDGSNAYYPAALTTHALIMSRSASDFLPGVSTASGFGGGSPTFAVDSGSSSTSMFMTATAGTAPSASGGVTMAFVPALPTGTKYALMCQLQNGTGTWDARASCRISTTSTGTFAILWDNNSVSLVQGSTYIFHFLVLGH